VSCVTPAPRPQHTYLTHLMLWCSEGVQQALWQIRGYPFFSVLWQYHIYIYMGSQYDRKSVNVVKMPPLHSCKGLNSPEPEYWQHILCCRGRICSEEEDLHCDSAYACSVLTSKQRTDHRLGSGNAAGQWSEYLWTQNKTLQCVTLAEPQPVVKFLNGSAKKNG
jgi:hypothetical protein